MHQMICEFVQFEKEQVEKNSLLANLQKVCYFRNTSLFSCVKFQEKIFADKISQKKNNTSPSGMLIAKNNA